MSTAQLGLVSAVLIFLISLLYPLWFVILMRRERARVAAELDNAPTSGSPERTGVGGMVLNMYVAQCMYVMVLWSFAYKSSTSQMCLLVSFLTCIKLGVAYKWADLFRYSIQDIRQRYGSYNRFFLWVYLALELSMLLDIVMFAVAASLGF